MTWTSVGNVLSFPLSGLSPSSPYTVGVRAFDAAGNRGPISSRILTTSGGGGGGGGAHPFPRIAISATIGDQSYPAGTGGANDAAAARYQLITIGGNYNGAMTSRARQAIVAGIKGQPKTGRTAVMPFVIQYENVNEIRTGSNWFPEWETTVGANNWWLYINGASGAKATSVWNASWNLCDMAHAAGAVGGLYPYQKAASLIHDRYFGSGLSAGGTFVATNLDGIMVDNMCIRNMAGQNADWLRSGSPQSQLDPTSVAACEIGKADLANWFAANASSYLLCGNTEGGADLVGYHLNPGAMNGAFSFPAQQFFWASNNAPNNGDFGTAVLNWGGFSTAMSWYKALSGFCKSGSAPLLTGSINNGSGDAALVRLAVTFTLVGGDGYAQFGTYSDNVDFAQSSGEPLPVADEFWGGSLNLAGYLGPPSVTAQGAIQTAAWSNGVWRRDFVNGIALSNSSRTASATVSLGGTYYHLRGSGVNTGTSVTFVTIPASDGLILLNSAPP
jgi:hypothetical protein